MRKLRDIGQPWEPMASMAVSPRSLQPVWPCLLEACSQCGCVPWEPVASVAVSLGRRSELMLAMMEEEEGGEGSHQGDKVCSRHGGPSRMKLARPPEL
ncbi:hypothetical protein llap_19946 [Limosa lapponica baueri]|uniref:Uncharacterized protein n=1 Tax=Limosa lapponica baueri TaxID=1758121 RepID=A0A2I0T7H4_LIMLA|nr:hypothetical protein llap_19946 [Limosa lapponica baueri]